jgi:hypothetical protein
LCANFSAAEVDVDKLMNALEILSETEKQLKTTKNQSTWLTAALLGTAHDLMYTLHICALIVYTRLVE